MAVQTKAILVVSFGTSHNDTREKTIDQIENRKYDAELIAHGVEKEHIRHYGFAFDGKKVLIG